MSIIVRLAVIPLVLAGCLKQHRSAEPDLADHGRGKSATVLRRLEVAPPALRAETLRLGEDEVPLIRVSGGSGAYLRKITICGGHDTPASQSGRCFTRQTYEDQFLMVRYPAGVQLVRGVNCVGDPGAEICSPPQEIRTHYPEIKNKTLIALLEQMIASGSRVEQIAAEAYNIIRQLADPGLLNKEGFQRAENLTQLGPASLAALYKSDEYYNSIQELEKTALEGQELKNQPFPPGRVLTPEKNQDKNNQENHLVNNDVSTSAKKERSKSLEKIYLVSGQTAISIGIPVIAAGILMKFVSSYVSRSIDMSLGELSDMIDRKAGEIDKSVFTEGEKIIRKNVESAKQYLQDFFKESGALIVPEEGVILTKDQSHSVKKSNIVDMISKLIDSDKKSYADSITSLQTKLGSEAPFELLIPAPEENYEGIKTFLDRRFGNDESELMRFLSQNFLLKESDLKTHLQSTYSSLESIDELWIDSGGLELKKISASLYIANNLRGQFKDSWMGALRSDLVNQAERLLTYEYFVQKGVEKKVDISDLMKKLKDKSDEIHSGLKSLEEVDLDVLKEKLQETDTLHQEINQAHRSEIDQRIANLNSSELLKKHREYINNLYERLLTDFFNLFEEKDLRRKFGHLMAKNKMHPVGYNADAQRAAHQDRGSAQTWWSFGFGGQGAPEKPIDIEEIKNYLATYYKEDMGTLEFRALSWYNRNVRAIVSNALNPRAGGPIRFEFLGGVLAQEITPDMAKSVDRMLIGAEDTFARNIGDNLVLIQRGVAKSVDRINKQLENLSTALLQQLTELTEARVESTDRARAGEPGSGSENPRQAFKKFIEDLKRGYVVPGNNPGEEPGKLKQVGAGIANQLKRAGNVALISGLAASITGIILVSQAELNLTKNQRAEELLISLGKHQQRYKPLFRAYQESARDLSRYLGLQPPAGSP